MLHEYAHATETLGHSTHTLSSMAQCNLHHHPDVSMIAAGSLLLVIAESKEVWDKHLTKEEFTKQVIQSIAKNLSLATLSVTVEHFSTNVMQMALGLCGKSFALAFGCVLGGLAGGYVISEIVEALELVLEVKPSKPWVVGIGTSICALWCVVCPAACVPLCAAAVTIMATKCLLKCF